MNGESHYETDGLSRYEREQLKWQFDLAETDSHAFASDYRDWGWFDPEEWYAAVKEIKAAGFC